MKTEETIKNEINALKKEMIHYKDRLNYWVDIEKNTDSISMKQEAIDKIKSLSHKWNICSHKIIILKWVLKD